MVECVPGIRRLGILCNVEVFQPRPDTHSLPVPIAMRMNWKSEQNILSNPRRQVDQFWSSQLDLGRKVWHSNRIDEPLKTTDTLQLNIYAQVSGNEQTGA